MTVGRTMTFSGKGKPGNLLDPNNWDGNVAPGVNDLAVIEMNVGGPVGGTVSVASMMLLGNETVTFTGTLNTLGVVGDNGLMVCVSAGATFAPGATLNDAHTLLVGKGAAGTLLAEGQGSTHSVLNTVTGQLGAKPKGVGTVTINDAVWNNSAGAAIGENGTGTLNVVDNGIAKFGGLEVGQFAGSNGQVTIASGGSVDVTGQLWVGFAPDRTNGTGSVSVGSGSSLTVDQTLAVGSAGTLNVAGGTVTAGVVGGLLETVSGGVISGYGTLAVPDGQVISDGGTIRASGGNLQMDTSVTGAGTLEIGADSTATITGSSLRLASISFIGPDATLSLAHGANVNAPISGFALGDVIAMANVTAETFTASTGMLMLIDNGKQVDSLHLLGNFSGDTFAVQQTLSDSLISLHHS